MAAISVNTTDTFEQWRVKSNDLSTLIGAGGQLTSQYTGNNIVDILNEIKNVSQFDNVITINDQALDGTTELAGNAAGMIISTGSQTVLTLNQTGDVNVHADLTTGASASIGTTLGVTGNATIGGTTTSQSTLIANAGLDCNGNADVSGTLDVTGNTSLAGTLSVTNATTLNNGLSVNSAVATMNNGLTVNGQFTANNATTFGDTLTVKSTLTANGNVVLGNSTAADITSCGSRVNTAIVPSSNNSYTLGESSLKWSTVYATTFSGNATTANYADLAELYLSDFAYEAGTVVRIGGEFEVTASDGNNNHSVLGVVSARPAYLMNNQLENGLPVALKGRVPVKVKGSVAKGDRLVGGPDGRGIVDNTSPHGFAIALEDFEAKKSGDGRFGVVEAVVL